MNDLRSPMEDRPYRSTERQSARLDQDDATYSTSEYYRTKFGSIRQSRWFPLASVFAAVLVFSGFISYAYKQGTQSGVNATTPVVEADKTDYKQKPANPGGMDVPFQDAVVFDQLQNKDQKTASGDKIESLLPPPEQPVAQTADAKAAAPATTEAPKTAEATSSSTTPATSQTATATNATPAADATKTAAATPATAQTNATPAAPATTETTTIASAPEAKPVTTEAAAPADEPVTTTKTETTAPTASQKTVAKTKTASTTAASTAATAAAAKSATAAVAKKMASVAPASAPANTKITSGAYRVQLGAFRDQNAAHAAWSKLQKEFSAQLSGVSAEFPRADLGTKGTFYRVQGVKLSKASADEICRTINSTKSGSCIVAK